MTERTSVPSATDRRTVRVDHLARVEGHGSLRVVLENGRAIDTKLELFESPRFFEALLRGRRFTEAPDITSRICGICPVAYQMSASQAMEDACGVRVDGALRDLRRLFYCGEWIQSHALHVYMLHAPDFLGYAGGLELARDDPATVERGLELRKVGNAIMIALGGRSIHPVTARVGGFYGLPGHRALAALRPELERGIELALETVRWVAGFEFPDFERDYELVALRHPDEYPILEGRIASNRGLDIEVREFEDAFHEEQVGHTNALHAFVTGRGPYLTGPLARYSLNSDRLSPLARDAAHDAGLGPVCTNPYRSIVVRSIEILYACEEALRVLDRYEPPARAALEVRSRAGTGYGCTEAPRGILYHRYEIDADGLILSARIVPPTSQNQASIEDDLGRLAERWAARPKDELTADCEGLIRCHDPCISCAVHFLDLELEER